MTRDLVQCSNVGREATVHTEHTVFNNSGDGHEVEDGTAVPPRIGVAIFVLALV